MAFSTYENTFALVPIQANGQIQNCLFWGSRVEADKHLTKQLAIAPELEKLHPFEILQITIPH